MPKVPSKRDDYRLTKTDEMYREIEKVIMMTVDDQPDAIYLASLMLTASKNMFIQFLGVERTREIFTELVEFRE